MLIIGHVLIRILCLSFDSEPGESAICWYKLICGPPLFRVADRVHLNDAYLQIVPVYSSPNVYETMIRSGELVPI